MSEMVRIALKQEPATYDVHLRACVDDAADVADLAHADVLYFARTVSAEAVVGHLAAYPGSVVCAGSADDGTLLLAVRGRVAGLGMSCPMVASIVHALLVWRLEIADAGAVGQPEP